MFLIRRMSFSAFLLPQLLGYFRKIGVRFGSRTVYLCQAKFVSERNSLLIYACLQINGHSGSAASGEDIVCAAVSSAAYLTANTITEILHADASVFVDDGEMALRLPSEASASGKQVEAT